MHTLTSFLKDISYKLTELSEYKIVEVEVIKP